MPAAVNQWAPVRRMERPSMGTDVRVGILRRIAATAADLETGPEWMSTNTGSSAVAPCSARTEMWFARTQTGQMSA